MFGIERNWEGDLLWHSFNNLKAKKMICTELYWYDRTQTHLAASSINSILFYSVFTSCWLCCSFGRHTWNIKHHLLSYTDSLNMRATHSSFLKCNEICKEFINCTCLCKSHLFIYLFFFSFVAQIARKTNIVQMVRDIYFTTVAIVCTAILTARRTHVFTSMCVKVLWEMLHASVKPDNYSLLHIFLFARRIIDKFQANLNSWIV